MRQRPVHRFARGMGSGGVLEKIRLSCRRRRSVLAGVTDAVTLLPHAIQSPLHRRNNQRIRIEAEVGGLPGPGLAQRLPVDIALDRARHQRRAPGQVLVLRGGSEAPILHRRLDLGPPCRVRIYNVSRHARDLEAPVGMGPLDAVAELLELPGKLAAVERAQQHLRSVQALVRHRPPLAVVAEQRVGDHRMGVQCRVEVSGSLVPEPGDHRLLVPGSHHASRRGVPHPGLGGVLLEPVERAPDRPVVGLDDARVAADERGEGHRFRRAEGQVTAGAVVNLAIAHPAAEALPRAVRHFALQYRPEGVGVDRTFEAELGGALARPGTGLPVLGGILGVVAIPFIVAGPLRRTRDRADRGDHQTQRP